MWKGLAVVRPAAAEHHAALEGIRHRLRPGGVPDRGRADLGRKAAKPVELRRSEQRVLVAEERIERHAALDQTDDQPILWCDVEQPVGRLQAAPARHVLHHDRRLAGNMAAKMGGKAPGVQTVATAHVRGDDQPNRLAAIEILTGGRPDQGRQRQYGNHRPKHQWPQHSRSPSTADIDKANGRYETRDWRRKCDAASVTYHTQLNGGNSSLSPAS